MSEYVDIVAAASVAYEVYHDGMNETCTDWDALLVEEQIVWVDVAMAIKRFYEPFQPILPPYNESVPGAAWLAEGE